MAQVIADRRDIDFVLYEQLEVETLLKEKRYSGMNRKVFDMLVNEARNFAVKEILPTCAEGDRQGVRFENGEVKAPDCFHRPYEKFVEGEWNAMTDDPEVGGQGFPHVVAQAAVDYLVGANFSFVVYAMAGHGTGKMIELFGTPRQKEMFLKNLYSGRWGGTMVLTESGAGSDVGALTTTAVKNPDGSWSITGNKIFISNGEHDLAENIIHPVLARIEGAPAGTRGISLFIVPKYLVNEDGTTGEKNDVVCTGVEEKMGLHGSATCSLTFGAGGKCRGMLLGEENQGMKIMFHMMNEVRLEVGAQGYMHGSAAYLYALDYARKRLQGRELGDMDPSAPSVPIIRHPDVRRMLLKMKAYVDGMRSLVYYVALCLDASACAGTEEEKAANEDMVALLTPVIKSYCTERGFDICVDAMQVFGGYGYTRDFPVEQLLRDCKITSIYEGTNGIQAMDFLGRKLGMKKGGVFMGLLGKIDKTVQQAKKIPDLASMALSVEAAAGKAAKTAMHIGGMAASPDVKTAFSFAHPFQEVTGDLLMGWFLLWRALAAAPKLEEIAGKDPEKQKEVIGKNKNAAFYAGQIHTARYFIEAVLPITAGKMDAIIAANDSVMKMPENSFGL